MSTEAPSPVRDLVVQFAHKLPAAPRIFARMSLLLESDETDTEEVENLISIDPALAAQVMQIANSAYYGGELGVTTLNEAIGRLGFNQVHRVVGLATSSRIYSTGAPAYGMSAEAIWGNSVAGALAAESLARQGGRDTHLYYTVGLLRQIGKLALNMVLDRENPGLSCPEGMDLLSWERARFGMTNLEATAEILESWKLPKVMAEAMRQSLDLGEGPHQSMAALIHLCSWVVDSLGMGVPGEQGGWRIAPHLCDMAGVAERAVQMAVTETRTEWSALRASMS